MNTYCTLFDERYLARGLTMCQSLLRFEPDAQIQILTLDSAAAEGVAALLPKASVTTFTLADLETRWPDLIEARSNRSLIEFYFTLSPAIVSWTLLQSEVNATVTYLDADLYFYSTPRSLQEELRDSSIGVIRHRFPPDLESLERVGLFNAGWASFKNDDQGRDCAQQWLSDCIDWCHDRVDETRYADQKYIDRWPEAYSRLHVVEHPGANVAPWNLRTHSISSTSDGVTVDQRPLVFFHFHGVKRLLPWLVDPNVAPYHSRMTRIVDRRVFAPYVRAVATNARALRTIGIDVTAFGALPRTTSPRRQTNGLVATTKAAMGGVVGATRSILSRQLLVSRTRVP